MCFSLSRALVSGDAGDENQTTEDPIAERAFEEQQDEALHLGGATCSARVVAVSLDLLLGSLL